MIPGNVAKIRERVDLACRRAGRDSSEVTLVAVTKTFPTECIREAVASGVHDIGENYVQELLAKRKELSPAPVRWHFIGHLQSNKVKYLAGWIHLIHAVDRAGLAEEINKRARQEGRTLDVMIEVNSTGEKSKYGVSPENAKEFVQKLGRYENIRILGLMTMSLFSPDPEVSRPLYRGMRKLREEISKLRQSNVEMKHLSMGMTGDFEVAIEEGATLIRIGTAIFGKRKAKD